MNMTSSCSHPLLVEVDWLEIFQSTTTLKTFFTSPASQIQNPEKSALKKSCTWLKEDLFIGTQDCFSVMYKKAISLKKVKQEIIEKKAPYSQNILDWHQSLIEVIQCKDLYGPLRFAELLAPYLVDTQDQKASSLMQFWKETSEIIETIDKDLMKHFGKDHSYQDILALKRFNYRALPIVARWQTNCSHLEQVQWNESKGVILPEALIQDCLRDLADKKDKSCKEHVRNAANFISIPHQAGKIEIILGTSQPTYWIPLHPVTNALGDVELTSRKGVRGSCERIEKGHTQPQGICNVYYFIDPPLGNFGSSQAIISCGVIDTKNKAKQIAKCIEHIFECNPSFQAKRWIFFQLNSFLSQEDKLISHAHQAAIDLEELLKGTEQNVEMKSQISVLHLNMAFNACSKYTLENIQSSTINQECLLKLTLFVMEEIGNPSQYPELIKLQSKINEKTATFCKHSKEILNLIDLSIRELEIKGGEQLICKLDKAILLLTLLRSIIKAQFAPHESPLVTRCTEIELLFLICKLLNIHIILFCKSGLDRSGSARSLLIGLSHLGRRLYQQAAQDCDQEEDPLKEFVVLDAEQAKEENKQDLDLVAPSLIEDKVQVEPRSTLSVNLSLNGKEPVLLSDPSLQPVTKENPPEEIFIKVYHRLFQFILNYPVYEQELNQMLYEMTTEATSNNTHFIEDLTQLEKVKAPLRHPRDLLLEKIKASQNKYLLETLFYQEIVVASLIRESIKTLFSTGIVGLKYHQDASYLKKKLAANWHPMERWPAFINMQKEKDCLPIQFKKIHRQWKHLMSWEFIFKSELVEAVVIQVFLRMSKNRGS